MLRGIEINNTVCCLCNRFDEDEYHLFIDSEVSSQIWQKVSRWINYTIPTWNSIDEAWLWDDGVPIINNQRTIIRVIVSSVFWNIWHLRNSHIFNDAKFKKSHVFDSIVVNAFEWMYSRFHTSQVNWTVWLQNPLNAL
ncbi:uncharacterized protein [Rutidosis leptorrhynchoides]|uniref:uncharacterized protein n=1 Tax=Rutidosis leptorrhynchoides TaxID=125765 RepID=UPI003A99DE2B